MRSRSIQTVALLALSASLSGCYSPDGGIFPTTNRGYTYVSTTMKPKTVSIIDSRVNEPFFVMEIPVGQQLTFKWLVGGGDDPVNTPDRLQWQLFEEPSNTGGLANQLTCPPENVCRIQIDLRPAPEAPPEPDSERLRIDGETPEWWTPEGGPIPERPGPAMYD